LSDRGGVEVIGAGLGRLSSSALLRETKGVALWGSPLGYSASGLRAIEKNKISRKLLNASVD